MTTTLAVPLLPTTDPAEETNQEDSSGFLDFLEQHQLGFLKDHLKPDDLVQLKRIVHIEESAWASVRWVRRAYFFEELIHRLFLRCAKLDGRSLPLENSRSVSGHYAITGCFQGGLSVAHSVLNTATIAFFGYTFIQTIIDQSPDIANELFSAVFNASSNGTTALLEILRKIGFGYSSLLFLAPFVWGAIRALIFAYQNQTVTEKDLSRWDDYVHGRGSLGKNAFMRCFRPQALPSNSLLWHDFFNHFIPMHATKARLRRWRRMLNWDGSLSLTQRKAIFKDIVYVATHGRGLTRLEAMRNLATIAHGVSTTQFQALEEIYGSELIVHFAKIKSKSLKILEKESNRLSSYWQEGGSNRAKIAYALYAHYLRWTLADSANKKWATAGFFFFLTKTGLQLSSLIGLLRVISQFASCPNENYNFAHGYQQEHTEPPVCYQVFSDQATFEEYVTALQRFELDQLNIASYPHDKGWNGTKVALGLTALRTNLANPTIIVISGENLSTPTDVEAVLSSLPPNLTELVIANCNLGNNGHEATKRLMDGLTLHFPFLSRLRLIRNNLDDTCANEIADFIVTQPNLALLDLTDNVITGNTTLVSSFGHTELKEINLSNNLIDFNDNSLVSLTLPSTLETLRIQYNYIGLNGPDSINFLRSQLTPNALPSLTTLNLAGNNIPGENMIQLAQNATNLSTLETLHLIQENAFSTATLDMLAGITEDEGWQTDIPTLFTTEHIDTYISTLNPSLESITLTNLFKNPSAELIAYFLRALATRCPNIQSIDASGIQLGLGAPNQVEAFGLNAKLFSRLNQVILFNNFIGYNDPLDSGCAALEQMTITLMPSLQTIYLNNNNIDDSTNSAKFLGAIMSSPIIKTIDVSGNPLGPMVTAEMGMQFMRSASSNLEHLNLRFTPGFGTNGSATLFFGGLARAPELKTLDVSYSGIDSRDPGTNQTLSNALRQLTHLEFFSAAGTHTNQETIDHALADSLFPTTQQAALNAACLSATCQGGSPNISAYDLILPSPTPVISNTDWNREYGQNITATSSANSISDHWLVRLISYFSGDSRKSPLSFQNTNASTTELDKIIHQEDSWACRQIDSSTAVCQSGSLTRIVSAYQDEPLPNQDTYDYCLTTPDERVCYGERTQFVETTLPIKETTNSFLSCAAQGAIAALAHTSLSLTLNTTLAHLGLKPNQIDRINQLTPYLILSLFLGPTPALSAMGIQYLLRSLPFVSDEQRRDFASTLTLGTSPASSQQAAVQIGSSLATIAIGKLSSLFWKSKRASSENPSSTLHDAIPKA